MLCKNSVTLLRGEDIRISQMNNITLSCWDIKILVLIPSGILKAVVIAAKVKKLNVLVLSNSKAPSVLIGKK